MARVINASPSVAAARAGGSGEYKPSTQFVLFFYLLAYNQASFMGWFFVLYTLVSAIVTGRYNDPAATESTWQALQIVQTTAVIEILNSAFRFVKAPVTTTAMQVASRLFLVWCVNFMFPQIRSHWSFSTMCLAWSIADMTRYAYYSANLMGRGVPGFLTWMRYNLFLVLYPLGVGSELTMVYQSLFYARSFSPAYFYFLISVVLVYVPGFPTLFSHMLSQRKKYLRGQHVVVQKKAQ